VQIKFTKNAISNLNYKNFKLSVKNMLSEMRRSIFVAPVGSGQPSLVWDLSFEIFPYKSKNFQFFSLWIKRISSG